MAVVQDHIERIPLQIPGGGSAQLGADFALPYGATGLVVFAHGSGSSRFSPRNRRVAEVLNIGGIGTILADLLTREEEAEDLQTAGLRFNIRLLADRLVAITDWVSSQQKLSSLPVGCFGASTGAAAALTAAAERSNVVRAVVSRGGRPDLAGPKLGEVRAPCLFIVGAADPEVLELNREAIAELPAATERRLEIIPGATHLFGEPGALDRVAALALNWFEQHLKGGRAA
jgi:dienelactone hydrolase